MILRFLAPMCAATFLTACETTPAATTEITTPTAALSDSRVTFASPDPDGGPIIFEFYGDGTALLVFDERADRGQTQMTWRIDAAELCVKPVASSREECNAYILRGTTLIMGTRGNMNGTIARL